MKYLTSNFFKENRQKILSELPENSIASLKQAIALKCVGSEFDVRMTADEVLVVNHNDNYHGLSIEQTTYAELTKFKLTNGERLPTLKDYILAGMQNNSTTGLVCEIKAGSSKERSLRITEKVVTLVKELNAEPFILSYISFDYDILKKIKEIEPKAKLQYLGCNKLPKELKTDGITGVAYHLKTFKNNPEWITSAKELGLDLNAWTINNKEDFDFFLGHGFNYITTDEPKMLLKISIIGI